MFNYFFVNKVLVKIMIIIKLFVIIVIQELNKIAKNVTKENDKNNVSDAKMILDKIIIILIISHLI
jgi:hypothetical protein